MEKKIPVSFVPCPSYLPEQVATSLKLGIAQLGGWEKFIGPKDRVLLKPNFVFVSKPEAGSSTHPALILEIARTIRALGNSVCLADSPGFGSCTQAVRALGIYEELMALGVEVMETGANQKLSTREYGEDIHKAFPYLAITKLLKSVDCVINIPKFKAHCQTRNTGAIKNLYGLVSGKRKALRHFIFRKDLHRFCQMLCVNALLCKPTLNIIDAVDSMEGTGPKGGHMRRTGFLAMSQSPFALDFACAEIFGLDPEILPVLKAAQSLRLCPPWKKVTVGELKTDLMNFKVPQELIPIGFSPPRLIKSSIKGLITKLGLRGLFFPKT